MVYHHQSGIPEIFVLDGVGTMDEMFFVLLGHLVVVEITGITSIFYNIGINMFSFFNKLCSFSKDRSYVSNFEAARLIRDLINHQLKNRWVWDDFESMTHSNLEVSLAQHLCYYYANKYPFPCESKYCGKEAEPYFLAIADALEQGLLHSEKQEEWANSIIWSGSKLSIPEELEALLSSLAQHYKS